MTTIVDHQIRQLSRDLGLVEPFNPEMVNPASIDVTLGSQIKVENQEGGWRDVDISRYGYAMAPGQFVLAHTEELIRVPNNMKCQFLLKSSRGREGYQHALATFCDPGFVGQVTLELTNLRRYQSLPLRKGLRIGQLMFSKLDEIPMRSYAVTGRYQNDMGAQISKG
jgi:dCTP deaminase